MIAIQNPSVAGALVDDQIKSIPLGLRLSDIFHGKTYKYAQEIVKNVKRGRKTISLEEAFEEYVMKNKRIRNCKTCALYIDVKKWVKNLFIFLFFIFFMMRLRT